MFLRLPKWLIVLVVFFVCSDLQAQNCIDKNATKLTKNLYKNLYKLKDNYTIFGHQDALAYGVGWREIANRSDVFSVVNDYPGLYGWDITNIELDEEKNIDSIPFTLIKKYIQKGYQRGGVITISWHANNPYTVKNAWDNTPGTLQSILPGNEQHAKYIVWLDRVAVFIKSLKTTTGKPIPILFRPFHELTGNWFWWGKNNSSPTEFMALWKFTQDYLMHTKKIHNLIYVFNTADFSSEADYLSRYPGDDRVDILSFDRYQYEQTNGREAFIQTVDQQLSILTNLTTKKNKIAALSETGFESIPDATWFTKNLYPLLAKYPVSHVLVWRNAGYMASTKKMHFYAPYLGQISADDFKTFYALPKILFEKKLAEKHIYQ